MAGDWIKMRAALLQSPKLIALARHLHRNQAFRDWLTPGGGGPVNGQLVSDDALRCVTGALLLRVWSSAREFGKFEGDDLLLPHISAPDLDLMAGCPGVGKAMLAVGWAEVKDGDHGAVVLPNFRQHNAPLTPAEKQSAYRSRQSAAEESVTKALPKRGNKSVTRLEKRREETKTEEKEPGGAPVSVAEPAKKFDPTAVAIPPPLDTPEFRDAWRRWCKHRSEIRQPLKPTMVEGQLRELVAMGVVRAVAAINHTIAKGWTGLREPEVPAAKAAVDDRQAELERRRRAIFGGGANADAG